ncbi:hypothetical protein L596_020634 [Steinernema carpocapsae]|uniref:Uncharacterized protein n=1 Tax=Steinernema carpocapsae TaxID=34508 RepID=A0A4U5MU67_STECR|nr:hypothetical protein L596_020634 [Steinernema carpocapsae]
MPTLLDPVRKACWLNKRKQGSSEQHLKKMVPLGPCSQRSPVGNQRGPRLLLPAASDRAHRLFFHFLSDRLSTDIRPLVLNNSN